MAENKEKFYKKKGFWGGLLIAVGSYFTGTGDVGTLITSILALFGG